MAVKFLRVSLNMLHDAVGPRLRLYSWHGLWYFREQDSADFGLLSGNLACGQCFSLYYFSHWGIPNAVLDFKQCAVAQTGSVPLPDSHGIFFGSNDGGKWIVTSIQVMLLPVIDCSVLWFSEEIVLIEFFWSAVRGRTHCTQLRNFLSHLVGLTWTVILVRFTK